MERTEHEGPRALLVEDDDRIRRVLTVGLADEGIEVREAASAEEALPLLDDDVDVALIDLMLPGVDGMALCRSLRERGDLPIIIVTARSDTDDVIAGLEAGADDYVTKPVVPGELAARVRALLRRRRAGGQPRRELVVADLVLRPEEGVVTRAGEPIALTRTEFRLLTELVEGEGRVVSREDLLQRVWGYDYFGDTRLLDVHVRRLRRKIEQDPDAPSVVLTVRGHGYRVQP
ncbi:response regulator transcription factor [Actinomycetospora corticicola]|uniref:DNA-binding response OmpR family regulator n=1 Tax=Actinomycetospora corticicola TaxID=663602 RepID=A0A7Y9DXR9_9PSEU|nr:response regulator transcription factor [Actinomycetospora corticicola]NYD37503.1 DNA-binding response OmpR family regulator [Actinomycetospora corticicola]